MATQKNALSWAGKLKNGGFLMAISIISFWASTSWAQTTPPDLNAITSATGADDWSMRMWKMLLGSFSSNPFGALGMPDSLLGSLFLVFNGCMFVVGFVWAMFGIVGGVVQTAHEGEVLGRRMSTIWFPIRMIVGIAGMVPIFAGFTLNQAIMMQLTIIGIGVGNTMWQEGVRQTDSYQGLTTQAFVPSVTSQAREAARVMFMGNVCIAAEKLAQKQALTQGLPALPASETPAVTRTDGAKTLMFNYGIPAQPDKCGTVVLKYGPGRSDSSAFGFRVASVDYGPIVTAANAAYKTNINSMNEALVLLADKWVNDRAANLSSGGVVPKIPVDQIDATAVTFNNAVLTSITSSSTGVNGGIKAAAKANMLSLGWFGAGAWYSTFAEVNAAIADAAKQPSMSSTFRGNSDTTFTVDAIKAASDAFAAADREKGQGQSGGDVDKALLDSAITDTGCGVLNNLAGTATGNCSFGQGIVSAAIRGTAAGSGGGGTQSGGWGMNAGGLVNPIIMLKNMGDYVMTFSTTILTVGVIGDTLGGAASKAGSVLPGAMGSAAKSLGNSVGKAASAMTTLAMALLVLGAAMAVYLPMIPFITWMGAILAYAASMIEGLAGATLHSMAHLESDGEGMGQRTSHGYMFYINALGRPALMVIGFFLASGLMIAIGTLQMQLFLPAMANAQGNSVTGLASIAMFLVIFFVLNWTLVQGSFNLIYVITDQVIGFVGGHVDSKLGRDTEDKANNMFLVAARTGPGMVGAFSDKSKGNGKGPEK